MIKIDFNKCTGCGACVQTCPTKCISWMERDFGFLYPKIDTEKCINCGKCTEACPINHEFPISQNQSAYSLINKNRSTLQASTSGGAFSAIAVPFIDKGGIVYGCAMKDGFKVQHIRVSDLKGISELQGSKYVQSETNTTFSQVKLDLDSDKEVLFSGTPCQIAGLYRYLGKEYDKLLTVDIVCHGVGSQAYFDKFIEYLESKYSTIESIEFRNKKFVGWSCGGVLTVNGKQMPFYNHEHYYYSYFLSGEIYRKCCYTCSYANMNRVGDITIGDFWGVEKLNINADTTEGCSLMLVNTVKGKEILDVIKSDSIITNVDKNKAIKNNAQLLHPSAFKPLRKKRLHEYNNMSGKEIQRVYVKTNIKRIIKGKVKALIPYSIKIMLRKITS